MNPAKLGHDGHQRTPIAGVASMIGDINMADDQRDTQNDPKGTHGAKPASPGDNRGADDVDGNMSGGASKAKAPTEPESPDDQDSKPSGAA